MKVWHLKCERFLFSDMLISFAGALPKREQKDSFMTGCWSMFAFLKQGDNISLLKLPCGQVPQANFIPPRSSVPPEELQSFVGKLPTHYAVNTSVVEHLWRTDASLLQRYRQLETSSNQLFAKAHRTANKLFSLSKRCQQQPKIVLQRPR